MNLRAGHQPPRVVGYPKWSERGKTAMTRARRQIKILFCHGINTKPDLRWLDVVNRSLELMHAASIPARVVVSPDYSDLLSATTVEVIEPAQGPKPYRNTEEERLGYLQRQADLGRRLSTAGITPPRVGKNAGRYPKPPTSAVNGVLKFGIVKQAQQYRRDPDRRSAIRSRVMSRIDPRFDWLVIGHSLGTLVALDLVRHIDGPIRVPLIITVASPLGHFHDEKDLFTGELDYQRIGGWLNLYNVNDPVPSGKGLSHYYPDVLDLPASLPARVHSASPLLSRPAVALEIQRARGGKIPKPPLRRGTRTMTWDLTALHAAAGLQLSYHTLELLKANAKGRAARYATARSLTIDEFEDALSDQARQAAASTEEVERSRRTLYVSFPDPRSSLAPFIKNKLAANDYATLLTVLVTTNPIAPFDIGISEDVRQNARKRTAVDFGMPGAHVDTARTIYKQARESYVTTTERASRTLRHPVAGPVMIGVGLVAVIAAPALIFAAAPAGLAGAAAVTSGLAALGPGGMMGGLAVVGTVGALGGATASAGAMAAIGRAVAAGSPADVRQWCIELMTRAAIDKELKITTQPGVQEREALENASATLNAAITRLNTVSDSDGPTLKLEKLKADYVRKAVRWVDKRGVGSTAAALDVEVDIDESSTVLSTAE
jgi:hypothetical protein